MGSGRSQNPRTYLDPYLDAGVPPGSINTTGPCCESIPSVLYTSAGVLRCTVSPLHLGRSYSTSTIFVPNFAPSIMLLDLKFDAKVRVSGEEIAGTVVLDYAELRRDSLELISVTLQGSMIT